jgi:hypothetical protein
MKPSLLLAFLLAAGICPGQTLRISEVVEAVGPETETMSYSAEESEVQLFVKKKAFISDGDVQSAEAAAEGLIHVKLSEAGAKKMAKVTGQMIPGRSRVALIVDGKVMTAPVIQSVPLGGSFQIDGFKDKTDEQLDDLARKISGRPPRPAGEAVRIAPPSKLPTVPYTEEEYRAIKAEREKMGIFFLDRIPSEAELSKKLRKGMNEEQVVEILGQPTHKSATEFSFLLASEKSPENPEGRDYPDGVQVRMQDGKVSSWIIKHGNFPRQEKAIGAPVSELRWEMPEAQMLSEDSDVAGFLNGIKVENPRKLVGAGDQYLMVSLISSLGHLVESPEKGDLDPESDLMISLACNFPEVGKLVSESKEERIPLKALIELLSPYKKGEKTVPGEGSAEAEGK